MFKWSSAVPLGSLNKETREKGRKILSQAIRLAHQLNIRVIQIAGYDVFYEEKLLKQGNFSSRSERALRKLHNTVSFWLLRLWMTLL